MAKRQGRYQVSGLWLLYGHEHILGAEKNNINHILFLFDSFISNFTPVSLPTFLNHLFMQPMCFKCQISIRHCSKHWVTYRRRDQKDKKYWEFTVIISEKNIGTFFPFNSLNICQGTVKCQVRSRRSTYEWVMWWGGRGGAEEPSSDR